MNKFFDEIFEKKRQKERACLVNLKSIYSARLLDIELKIQEVDNRVQKLSKGD